jgi:hypothetical protein
MARALDEVVRLDRRWFWAHPHRQHRCRWPDTCELELCDCDRGARLVIAIRHLGGGCFVYQPVILQGALPVNEESTAALFALAATSPEPIPVLAQAAISVPLSPDRRIGRHRVKRALTIEPVNKFWPAGQ